MKPWTMAEASRVGCSDSNEVRMKRSGRCPTLLERAKALGIDAHMVQAEAFDELFVDLIR